MSDGRDTSWQDGRDRQRHHHPAVDYGRDGLRDQHGNWVQPGPNDYPQQRQPAPGYGPEYGPDPGYGQPGYDNAYGPADYSPGYPDNGYAPEGQVPNGYGGYGPGYQQQGYEQGYGQEGYPPGYDPGGYDQSGYDQGGYGYPQPGYPSDQHYPGQNYPDQNYPDQNYPDQGYADQGYADQGYSDQGYSDQGYQEQGYPGPGYYEQERGAQSYDPRYAPQGYGAADSGDYHTGSFIERGFDGANPGGDPSVTTGGRNRVVRSGEMDPRTTGSNRRIAAAPVDVDFPRDGKKRKKRRKAPLVLFIVLVLLAVIGGGAYWGIGKVRNYFGAPDYTGMGSGDVKVKVAKGDTATAIASTLLAEHVVKSTKAFINAAKADPKSVGIEAGWYRLHQHMSAKNALEMLEAKDAKGNPLNLFIYKVTIPEGTISVDIYTLLSQKTGIPASQFIDAAKDPTALGVDKSWFTAKRDDGRTTVTATEKGFKYPAMIEGFLFPATYSFQPDETAKQMLTDMVSKFNQVAASINFANVVKSKLQIPPIEALIAASIAQKEASTPQDMAGVTKVLYNRVFKGLANKLLGVDSETNYFLRMTGHDAKTSDKLKASEINNPNDPYNTHTVPGFPPGAISNPGLAALQAAINPDPAKAGYAYFQTVGNNPKVVFSKTYAEFCALNTSC